jgi:hypothetical protein
VGSKIKSTTGFQSNPLGVRVKTLLYQEFKMQILKSSVASRLLHSELTVRAQLLARLKHMVEEVDMALYDRSTGIGFMYGNLGDLVRRVQAVGATARPSLFSHALDRDVVVKRDSLAELKDNVDRLQEMHRRLQFMLCELEGLVKKS